MTVHHSNPHPTLYLLVYIFPQRIDHLIIIIIINKKKNNNNNWEQRLWKSFMETCKVLGILQFVGKRMMNWKGYHTLPCRRQRNHNKLKLSFPLRRRRRRCCFLCILQRKYRLIIIIIIIIS